MSLQCYAVPCIVNVVENPQNCPSPWDFVTLLEENEATAIGNMHIKFDNLKNLACGSGDILTDGQTRDTHRQTWSIQYFKTAPVGKVKKYQQIINRNS